jgi:hypothetical protein
LIDKCLAGYEERVWLVVVELGGFKNLSIVVMCDGWTTRSEEDSECGAWNWFASFNQNVRPTKTAGTYDMETMTARFAGV